ANFCCPLLSKDGRCDRPEKHHKHRSDDELMHGRLPTLCLINANECRRSLRIYGMLVIKQPSQLEVNRFVTQRNALLDRQCREHASVVGEPQWWRRPEHWVDNRSIGC